MEWLMDVPVLYSFVFFAVVMAVNIWFGVRHPQVEQEMKKSFEEAQEHLYID